MKEEKFTPNKVRGSVLKDIRVSVSNRSFMMILCLTIITTCSVMTIEPILPLYIGKIDDTIQNTMFFTGVLFSLPGIANILFGPFWGKLADKIGFHRILFIGLLGGGIGSLSQMMFTDIWGFSIARLGYGIFFCAVFPALNGLMIRATPEGFRGRAFGLKESANQLGYMIGPIIGGVFGGFFPMQSVFLITGSLLLVAAGMCYACKEQEKSKEFPAKQKAI
ncbi:MFS transporter [Halalkalibacter lacteus]|uniref:MFS transporter n=1 Tax=Halalkalibacter lacteus TaxID=3090663 RepID=UPI002FCB3E84